MSILDQLKKYQQAYTPTKTVEVPDQPSGPSINFGAIAAVLNCDPKLLHSMPYYTWTNVLYPVELVAAYHLYSLHHYVSEDVCNSLTVQFMRRVHPAEYTASFTKAMDATVARLMQARALVATFYSQPTKFKHDRLSAEFRPEIAALLGVAPTITAREASNIMVGGNNAATFEQQILGRVGYLILWSKLMKSNIVPEGLAIGYEHI